MTRSLQTLALAAAWLATAVFPQAQTGTPEYDPLGEHDELPKLIRVQVEFIEVAHDLLTELLFAPSPSANDTALRAKLADLTKQGKASVVETMMVTSRSGQKATSESIKEFIYPTEYEPAELPLEIHTTASGEKVASDGRDHATGPTPTAFETRNLGSTLDVEPTLGADNRLIDLVLAPEIVYHVGNQTWAEWKGKYGNSPVQMPIFYTLRFRTGITAVAGQPVLVAALSPKTQDGFPDFSRKLMVFVKCDVLTVGR